MARLYLFGEGQTEQTFADAVLKPHLANVGVYLHRPITIAHAKKKGRVHRGGGRNYVAMKHDILRMLSQEKAGDVFFTTMIDLYGISSQSPGREEAENLRHLPYKRVELLEQAFSAEIGDPRFIPYIQLHEYEAYLFSEPSLLEFFYDHHARAIAALRRIADAHTSPELIDDGEHTAPSKRIIAEIPDFGDAKPVVGPQVAELIGLNVIRAKCPHFNDWLTRLEHL